MTVPVADSHQYGQNYSSVELEYPLRTDSQEYGLSARFVQGTFNKTVEWRNLFEDSHPSEVLDGFRLIFHDSFELPSMSSTQFYTLTNHSIKFLITPEKADIDDSLMDLPPEK